MEYQTQASRGHSAFIRFGAEQSSGDSLQSAL
jgi:hypothetical protein